MKSILSIFTAALLLLSCNNSTYKISGIIDEQQYNDTVYLGYSNDGYNFIAVDSTITTDGKFEFGGNIDDSKIYYISYNSELGPTPILFILEPGEISMEIGRDYYRVTGTPNNDLNQDIDNVMFKYVDEILQAQEVLNDSLANDSTISQARLSCYVAETEAKLYIKKVITENIKSLTALLHLVTFAEFFTTEELNQLIEQIPEENKDRDNNPLFDILSEIQYERQDTE